jgi:hypothetical protein
MRDGLLPGGGEGRITGQQGLDIQARVLHWPPTVLPQGGNNVRSNGFLLQRSISWGVPIRCPTTFGSV